MSEKQKRMPCVLWVSLGPVEPALTEITLHPLEDNCESAEKGIYPSIQECRVRGSCVFSVPQEVLILSLKGTVECNRQSDGDSCQLYRETRASLEVPQRKLSECVLNLDDSSEFGVESDDTCPTCCMREMKTTREKMSQSKLSTLDVISTCVLT